MRSRWKTKFYDIEGASKFHKSIQTILIEDEYFKSMNCYQEVPVEDLAPGFPYKGYHYDWYIQPLNCIIELHGQQHYKVTRFGNYSMDTAIRNFEEGTQRDTDKEYAALENNYTYIVISYIEQKRLCGSYLRMRINEGGTIE